MRHVPIEPLVLGGTQKISPPFMVTGDKLVIF
jgi:hypothetical protein